MTIHVDIDASDAELARAVREAAEVDEIVLERSGIPLARLRPVGMDGGPTAPSDAKPTVILLEMEAPTLGATPRLPGRRRLGRLEGTWQVPADFDAPLPDDILDLFEGKA